MISRFSIKLSFTPPVTITVPLNLFTELASISSAGVETRIFRHNLLNCTVPAGSSTSFVKNDKREIIIPTVMAGKKYFYMTVQRKA
jgi:hypothetical protein